MNFITRETLLIIFKLVNPKFSFKQSAMVESKAKHKDFRFFYFYGLSANDKTVPTISQFQHTFKKMYPNIHVNITQNKNGLTVWLSDNLKYDEMMVNPV